MTDSTGQENQKRSPRTILRYLTVSACIFIIISLYAIKIYLSSPQAASRFSHLIATSLHQPFTIESLELTAQGITLKGISLGNPAGFPQRNMVTIRSALLSPKWTNILRGRRSFGLVSLDQPRIDLHRDSSGRWNFESLKPRFATGKPGPGLSIARLVIRDGTVTINDREVSSISLQLLNLETKGRSDANLMLTFEDGAHDRFSLEGTVRPGKEPAYTMRLTAPRITLAAIPELTGKKPAFPLSGTGSLLLNTAVKGNNVTADMEFGFAKVPVAIDNRKLQLSGIVEMRGTYDRKLDRAHIEKADISVNDLVRLHVSGTMNRLKSKREFSILAGIDNIDVSRIAGLLPEHARKGLTAAGTVESRGFRISGAGREIAEISGALTLRNGSVSSGAESILRGVSGELTISPSAAGLVAAVTVRQKGTEGKELFQGLAVNGALLTDRHLKPLTARISSISGKVEGIEFSGNAAFIPGAQTPVSATLTVPETDLSRLTHLPAFRNAVIEGGRGSLSLELSGSGIRQATGMVNAHISRARGKTGGKQFGIGDGTLTSGFTISGRHLSASGTARLRQVSYGNKSIDGVFDYLLADRTFTINHARFATDNATMAIDRVAARIPQKQLLSDAIRYPLSMEFSGCSIGKGDLAISGMSGKILADYLRKDKEQWLEGSARLESSDISLKGSRIGAPAVNLAFARQGARGVFAGSLLSGKLSGNLAFDPFAVSRGTTLDITLSGASLREAVPLIPATTAVKPDSGIIDAAVKGSYAPESLLNAAFTVNGRDISLLAKGGKQILNKVTTRGSGSVTGKKLALDRAVINAGDGISLEIRGDMNNFSSPEREGRFDAMLGKTDINLILDRFANNLPRLLQEATASGSVVADATLLLKAGKPHMNGEIGLEGITLGVESQKLNIGRINGSIPISFAPSQPKLPDHRLAFTRKNFSFLVEKLGKSAVAQHSVTIGGISFGPIRLGETRILMRSDKGLTEITSLRSSLYEGALLGTAYLTLSNGYSYRADLLMDDLSLTQLCNSFPKIKGYISGRVEGLLSLSGSSQRKEGPIGLTELWTQETRGERMLVSREFLQKLANKKLGGFFFSDDRPYDKAEISASLEKGYLEFYDFNLTHTNFFGVRDLSVTIAESRNRIALEHLFISVKNAAARGKSSTGAPLAPVEKPAEQPEPGFSWEE